MSRPLLLRAGVDAASAALVAHLKPSYGRVTDDPAAAARVAVEAYLAVARDLQGRRVRSLPFAPLTRQIAAMVVGQVLHAPMQPLSQVHGRFRAARRLMDAPLARWKCDTLPTGEVRIERLADGADNRKRRRPNATAHALAALSVGETTLLAGSRRVGLANDYKVRARELLGEPTAKWSYTTTTQGLRVRRVA